MNMANKLVKGAVYLTIASLISKVLSAAYRVPLQNLAGDIGFYVYQQVYPFIGIWVILALYGYPSAISKLSAQMMTKGQKLSITGFYFPILTIMLCLNGGLFILLHSFSGTIAQFIGDPQLTSSYQTVAYGLLVIPFVALLRGSFQGHFYMLPTALSQVGEQFIRVFIIIYCAYLYHVGQIDIYQIGESGAIAGIVGLVFAFIILLSFFFKQQPFTFKAEKIPWKSFIYTIIVIGIVGSFNHMVLLIIQFADAFTLVPGLIDYGFALSEAKQLKGIFDRGQPLIQLATVLGSSFALAIIPAVSKETLSQNLMVIQSGLLFCFYLSIGATAGLIAIMPEVNLLLFQSLDGTFSLRVLSLTIFFSSMAITLSTLFIGLNFLKRTTLYIVASFSIKWIGNVLLVPLLSIVGSSIATVSSLFLFFLLLSLDLKKRNLTDQFIHKLNLKTTLAACVGMVAYIYVIKIIINPLLISSRFYLLFYVLFTSATGAIIYILIVLKGRAFTKQELSLLPFHTLLIRFHKGRDVHGA